MSLCPVGTQVQTVFFVRPHWSLPEAHAWLRRYGFSVRKHDTTKASFRFRQRPPKAFRAGSFRTITLAPGVKAVVGCPKD